jgi:uncharacterized glyoxalase superfamily protein PhnB
VRQFPDLENAEPLGEPDTLLDEEEREAVSLLTAQDLKLIDEALLANIASSWRKVARVVGTAMIELNEQLPGVPDEFYAQRVTALVQTGRLQSQGNLDHMRFSEVRLAAAGKSAGKPAAGTTIWSIGSAQSDQFAPGTATFMVNYRVEDLRALVGVLHNEGCNVLEKIDDSEYGKFAWVIDPEGNKVELWQPPAGQ